MVSWRRGIEPVIAAVILIAVAIVVAVAVVGWILGLWSGLAGGNPQITSNPLLACIDESAGTVSVTIYIVNSGAGSDKLIKAYLEHGGTTYEAANYYNETTSPKAPIVIPSNSNTTLTIEFNNVNANPGDRATVKLIFERSGTQPLMITVQKCATGTG